jgi:hypothetical protein
MKLIRGHGVLIGTDGDPCCCVTPDYRCGGCKWKSPSCIKLVLTQTIRDQVGDVILGGTNTWVVMVNACTGENLSSCYRFDPLPDNTVGEAAIDWRPSGAEGGGGGIAGGPVVYFMGDTFGTAGVDDTVSATGDCLGAHFHEELGDSEPEEDGNFFQNIIDLTATVTDGDCGAGPCDEPSSGTGSGTGTGTGTGDDCSCSDCSPTYTATWSGFTGDQAPLNGKSFTIEKDTSDGGGCGYQGDDPDGSEDEFDFTCSGGVWSVTDIEGVAVFGTVTGSCPTGTFSIFVTTSGDSGFLTIA